MRNFLCFSCLLFCLSASAFGAPRSASESFSCERALALKEGQEAATKVQNRYQSVTALSADFIQESYLATLEQSETSSGKVWFSRPGMMRWDYERPESQQFLLKDRTMWLYQPELNQAVIQDVEQVFISNLPVSFLLGIGNLTTDFKLQSACSANLGLVLTFVPARSVEGDSLAQFTLLADPVKFLPSGAKVKDAGGNVTSIVLRNTTTTLTRSGAELFTLKLPAGTDISDRRGETAQ